MQRREWIIGACIAAALAVDATGIANAESDASGRRTASTTKASARRGSTAQDRRVISDQLAELQDQRDEAQRQGDVARVNDLTRQIAELNQDSLDRR